MDNTNKPEFLVRKYIPRPEPKSRKVKAERRARYERIHVIQGNAGDIVTIGGTRYKIAPAGNIVKVQ